MYNRYGTHDIEFPIYPHGHLCISVNFQIGHTGVYLFGLNRGTWNGVLTKKEFVFGGAFTIGDIFTLFAIPGVELTDKIINLGDIWPSRSQQLIEQIAEASTMMERAIVLEAFFRGLVQSERQRSRLVSRVIDQLYENPVVSVQDLAETHGVSRRQLSRLFAQHVGISPKNFSNILRLTQVKRMLQLHPGLDLSELSFKLGFYDQAHFNREFKRYYKTTPTSFIKNGLDLL
ncbi:helix-turn-helix domain-containing protein [Desulforhopalus sp. 52FAK]